MITFIIRLLHYTAMLLTWVIGVPLALAHSFIRHGLIGAKKGLKAGLLVQGLWWKEVHE